MEREGERQLRHVPSKVLQVLANFGCLLELR